jgi:hypothetical protein
MQWVTRTATTDLNVQLRFTPFVETSLPWRQPVGGCGKQFYERRFVVMGNVVNASDQPVPNMPVRLSWTDTSRKVILETTVHARADEGGGFIVCGIPSDRRLGSTVVGPDGVVHTGTARITRLDPDGTRKLPANTRALTLRIPDR